MSFNAVIYGYMSALLASKSVHRDRPRVTTLQYLGPFTRVSHNVMTLLYKLPSVLGHVISWTTCCVSRPLIGKFTDLE
jgi:hypothetical protein